MTPDECATEMRMCFGEILSLSSSADADPMVESMIDGWMHMLRAWSRVRRIMLMSGVPNDPPPGGHPCEQPDLRVVDG